MKRPWHVWSTFAVCLALAVPAMIWLTLKALELDRAEAEARRQAELEEKISLALWRMDTLLTPLLAQEAARPHFVYRPFLSVRSGGKSDESERIPSPLLTEQPENVLLNFQWSPDESWTSPQVPRAEDNRRALHDGVSPDLLTRNMDRLRQLRDEVDEYELLDMLPTETLPPVRPSPGPWANNVRLRPEANAVIANRPAPSEMNQTPRGPDLPGQQEEADPVDRQPQRDQHQRQSSAEDAEPPGVPDRAQGDPGKRGGREWERRNEFYQNYAQQAVVQQRTAPPNLNLQPVAREGNSRVIWIHSNLLLARRVISDGQVSIQGSWLDWPRIKKLLLSEVSELVADADLVPVVGARQSESVGHMLATLPVKFEVPAPAIRPAPFSPIRISLWIAWSCLVLATVAVAAMLRGVISLSERRASFVSAVTHELRTPLTTFRMYSEMLAEGMVPDPQARKRYLVTLRAEADRLSHLVENVLSYARLERGRPGDRQEVIQLDPFVKQLQRRLSDRTAQDDMTLEVEVDGSACENPIRTDPAAVEQILFNLVDNACKYASTADDRRIHLQVTRSENQIRFCVRDHGPGLSPDAVSRLFRPFSKSAQDAARTAPGVGLGLALCRRLARQLGGRLELDEAGTHGAQFVLTLPSVVR